MSAPAAERGPAEKEQAAEQAKFTEKDRAPETFTQDVDQLKHKLQEIANATRMAEDSPSESAEMLRAGIKEDTRQAENLIRLLGNEATAKGFGVTFEHGSAMATQKEAAKEALEMGFPQMAKYLENFNEEHRKLAEMEMRKAGMEKLGRVPSETEQGGRTEYWFRRGSGNKK